MKEDQQSMGVDALLISVDSDKNNLDGGSGGNVLPPQPAGFIGFPQPPMLPQQPSDFQPFNYPVSSVPYFFLFVFYLAAFLSDVNLTCHSYHWSNCMYVLYGS
jgi:hypothetical protein